MIRGGTYIQKVEIAMFKKPKKKELKKYNFVQHEKYSMKNATQKIQHIYKTRKIWHQKNERFE